MEKSIRILIVLLTVSLALNVLSFSRLGQIQEEMDFLNNNYTNKTDWLSSRIDNLSSNINELLQENQWLQKIDFKPLPEQSSPAEIHLDLEFAFNEIEKQAEVLVFYKDKELKNWSKVVAQKDGSVYRASLILDPQKNYEYKLTASGDTEKTTELKIIPVKFYKPMPLLLKATSKSGSSASKINHFSATFSQLEPVFFDFFKVSEAYVKVYKEGQLSQVIDMNQISNNGNSEFEFEIDIDESITSLVAFVKYGNGTTYEREIYPNNDYMKDIDNLLKDY